MTDNDLQLIKPDGTIYADVPAQASSVQFCSANQARATMPRPVSATNDAVYFRDGDTKIREVVPPSSAVDVTTVPGGPTKVSFFSVSPDDTRIAVLVEDLSGASISERLYVEDPRGGGHHADIYTTTQSKGDSGTTLWPMGWHDGALVLALVQACSAVGDAGLYPIEWHVSSASTAARIATIRGTGCRLSTWPAAAGVGCFTYSSGVTTLYGWDGKVVAVTGPGKTGNTFGVSGLSPSGNSIFFVPPEGVDGPPPVTGLVQLGPGPYATVQGHAACAWIDEDHLLAPDAVIAFPAETPGNVQVNATATPLAVDGNCAGRFPGSL